jgi:hypothetical protein
MVPYALQLFCLYMANIVRNVYPLSRIRISLSQIQGQKGDTVILDVYAGSGFFSSRIQGAENTGSRIGIRKTVKELGFVISYLID